MSDVRFLVILKKSRQSWLVLGMRSLFLIFLTIALAACNGHDETANTVLDQPPYQQLTDSIKLAPNDALLYYRRGSLLYSNNLYDAAVADIRHAWQLDPQEEYALNLTVLLRQKNTDSAIAFLQTALKRLPNSVALRIGLARGYQQKGQKDQALEICRQILANEPGQLDAMMLQSELLKEQNKNNESLAVMEKAYSMAPGDASLAQNLAFAYAEAGNPKVLPLCDSLIAADKAKRSPEPYYFKGVYYSNVGRSADAIRQFDAAIQHDFHYIDAYINKGIVYYDAKQYPQALKVFAQSAAVFPDESDPYYWMAKTQEAMGNKPDAKLNYERAYGLDKTRAEAKQAADRL